MIGTPEIRESLKPGAIVQLSPKYDGDMPPHLMAVVRVHSWGCDLSADGSTASYPIAWEHFELTGGALVWGPDGNPLQPQLVASKHHP